MKKKVTITATDRIGRTESITFLFEDSIVDRLVNEDCASEHSVKDRLAILYDDYIYNKPFDTIISYSQFKRLRDFYNIIHHKFYNYELSIHYKE